MNSEPHIEPLKRGEHLTIRPEPEPENKWDDWVPAIITIAFMLFGGGAIGHMLGYNHGFDDARDIYQHTVGHIDLVAHPAAEEPCNGCKQITLKYPWELSDCQPLLDWWNHSGGFISESSLRVCASALSANRLVNVSEQR